MLDKMYPEILKNTDYSAIINERRYSHLVELLEDALKKGAVIYVKRNNAEKSAVRLKNIAELATNISKAGIKMAPSLILKPSFQMNVMKEEIFGPILPVFFIASDREAVSIIEKNERPLAFYWFGRQKKSLKKWLINTVSGGVSVNDCLIHCVQNDLPFGGISKSGQGAYHGFWGFENFSHRKGIFSQSRVSAIKVINPPYTKIKYKLVKILKKLT